MTQNVRQRRGRRKFYLKEKTHHQKERKHIKSPLLKAQGESQKLGYPRTLTSKPVLLPPSDDISLKLASRKAVWLICLKRGTRKPSCVTKKITKDHGTSPTSYLSKPLKLLPSEQSSPPPGAAPRPQTHLHPQRMNFLPQPHPPCFREIHYLRTSNYSAQLNSISHINPRPCLL